MVREFQYERRRAESGAPPWDRRLQYIENSPIFWVKKIPDALPHDPQRRGRRGALVSGNRINNRHAAARKEPTCSPTTVSRNGLRNRDNMKQWTVHMDEFFDHYILGKPRPEWMDKGVTYLDRGKRDVAPSSRGKPRRPRRQRRTGKRKGKRRKGKGKGNG